MTRRPQPVLLHGISSKFDLLVLLTLVELLDLLAISDILSTSDLFNLSILA